MPWKELKPMDLKVMFIADYLSQKHSLRQLLQKIGKFTNQVGCQAAAFLMLI